jgi:hypothetical protein
MVFRETARAGISALALGLMAAGTFGVSLIAAPPAEAQSASSQEFADAFKGASEAISARKFSDALPKIEQADRLAKGQKEKGAVAAARVHAYYGLGSYSDLITANEPHKAIGGLTAAQQKSYNDMLAFAYSKTGHNA